MPIIKPSHIANLPFQEEFQGDDEILAYSYNLNKPMRVSSQVIQNLQGDIITIGTQVSFNEQNIAGLGVDVSANAEAILTLESGVSVIVTQVDENTSQIATNAYATATLSTKVDTNISSIGDLEGELDAQASSILTLHSEIDTLTTVTNGNVTDIEAHSTAIASLETNVSINSIDIEGLGTDVSVNASSILNLESSVSFNASDIEGNTTNITTNSSSIASLQTTVSTHTDDISANADSILLLQSQVSTNTTQIDGNATNITTNASSIASLETNVTVVTDDVGVLQSDSRTIIRSDNEPTQRPSGGSLQGGDIWVHTGTGGGQPYIYNGTAFDEYYPKVLTNASAILNLESDVSTNTTNIGDNSSSISSNASSIATLQTNVSSIEGDVDSNTSAVITLESNVSTLDGEVDTLQSEITLKVNAGDVVAAINVSADKINGARITVDGNTTFTNDVTIKGTLSGVNGTFTGTLSGVDGNFTGQVTATSGHIGAVILGTNLSSQEGANRVLIGSAGSSGPGYMRAQGADAGSFVQAVARSNSSDRFFEVRFQGTLVMGVTGSAATIGNLNVVNKLTMINSADITNSNQTFSINPNGISVKGGSSFGDPQRAFVVRDYSSNEDIGFFTGVGRQVRLASESGADLALRPANNQLLRFLNMPTSNPGSTNAVYAVPNFQGSGHKVLCHV